MSTQGSSRRRQSGDSNPPPWSQEAEESVLGACLLDTKAFSQVAEILRPGDFYDPSAKETFGVMLELSSRGKPVDRVTVQSALERSERIGESAKPWIATLLLQVGTLSSALAHAELVRENAVRRRLIEDAAKIGHEASNGSTLPDTLEFAHRAITQAGDRLHLQNGFRPITAAKLLASPPAPTPHLLGSFITSGGLYVVAGPTKIGKTNLQLHIAWALTEGVSLFGRFSVPRPTPTLLIELELTETTLRSRIEELAKLLEWGDGLERFTLRCERDLLVDAPDGAERLARIIEAADPRPEVVILDSYNAAFGGDPDRSHEARRALHALRVVQKRNGVAFGLTCEVRKQGVGQRSSYSLDDLKGSNEVAYDADAVALLRPLNADRRRISVHFAALRHSDEESPDFVLERRGLTFECVAETPDRSDGDRDDSDDEVEEAIREHLDSGGSPGVRAVRGAVQSKGIRVQAVKIDKARRRVLEGADS